MSGDRIVLDDDALVARLRAVASEADPVPAPVLDLARTAFTVRDLDAELAVLLVDSAESGSDLVGVRGDNDVRLLSYEAAAVGLELQVEVRDGKRTLLGQVFGARPASIVVESGDDEVAVEPDAQGLFRADGLATGRLRLRLVTATGLIVLTPWTSV